MRAIGRAACAVLAAAACGCTGPFAGTGTEPVDRLVFVDLEGRVVTSAPDGSEPTVVSADGEVGFQPVWSPDGGRLAYVAQGGGVSVADLDTGSLLQVNTDVQPFYLHWSPGGERIAALRNSAEGIALELVEVASDGLDTEVVDTGQPYYFSWQPDGDRLVVHVGADRLDLLDPSGETEELGVP
ncbi:MAG: TolB family protein, partial [bacterium]